MERVNLGGLGYDNGGVMMTRDPKPRLRWTADLHDRFVDAVAKLGGADSKLLLLSCSIEDNRFHIIIPVYSG